ncbi:hypothetical protein [Niveispirillum irakense]|uniref:hypothetical protein n=1 Tax=Niveispirillum irakense TaxID=34011 RepID=UPI00048FB70C|nr:hypothetical protein [Niveispirillum irakense]
MEEWQAAWGIWLSGKKVYDECPLFGHTVIWWNRAGQMFQFLAALIVVFEVIGKEKCLEYGKKFLFLAGDDFIDIWKGMGVVSFNWFYGSSIVLVILGGLIINIFGKDSVAASVVKVIFYVFVLPGFIGLFIFVIMIPISIFLVAIGYVMSRKTSDKIFKIIGIILALLGFHFTLLAS